MKIAVDYDGTIMYHAVTYAKIIKAFQDAGHEVGILTGRDPDTKDEDIARLEQYGIVPDFFINASEWMVDRLPMARDVVNCYFKAMICHSHDIDILFDDAEPLIRLFLPDKCSTIVFKSPTEYNQVIKEWGKDYKLVYEEAGDVR